MSDLRASSTTSKLLLVFVLAAVAVLFVVRGPAKAMQRSGDLYLIYAASKTWLAGENPYDAADQRRVVYDANDNELPRRDRELISLYPPATFVVMSPFVLGSFTTTQALWLGVNLLSLALLIVGAARLAEIELASVRGGWLVAAILGLGAVASSVWVGQVTLPVAALSVWGLYWQRQDAKRALVFAGIALGVAAALKPQLAGLFVLYLAMRGRWLAFGVACAVGAAILGVGILRLEQLGIDWQTGLRANVAAFEAGGVGDAGPGNVYRYQMIHLEAVLRALWDAPALMSMIVIAVGLAVTALAWRIAHRARTLDNELLAMGLLTLVSLFVVYHRYYDATLLVVPMLWMLLRVGRGMSPALWVAMGALLVLMLPAAGLIGSWTIRGKLPESLTELGVWQNGVYLFDAWALAVLTGALVVIALSRERLMDHAEPSERSTAKN